jgi:hypothetical protein
VVTVKKKPDNTVREDMKKQKFSYTADENIKDFTPNN